MLRKHLIAMLGVLAFVGLAAPASAADYIQGISASPPIQRIELSAGSTFTGSVEISNPGKTEYNFTVSSSPFSVKGESYELKFASRPDLVDASRWFTFPTSKFHLKPGQRTPVQFNVKVPADAAGGGYYAMVFAQADPPPGSGGITAQKRVGVLTYMTVAGDIKREGHLASFSVPFIQTQPPLVSEVRVQNTGNVHFESTESLQIKDLFGNVKAQLETSNTIFPKTIRKVRLDWAKSPAFGLYSINGTVKYLDHTEKLPTRWTLMLSANAFLIIAGVLIAMGIFAYLTRRSRGNVRRG